MIENKTNNSNNKTNNKIKSFNVKEENKYFKIIKLKRENYKVGWFLIPIFSLILLIFSVLQLTILGWSLDSFVFEFLFGTLFKYFVYFLIFIIALIYFLSFKIVLKLKLFILFIILFICFSWVLSNMALIVLLSEKKIELWSLNNPKSIFLNYLDNWFKSSILNPENNNSSFIFNKFSLLLTLGGFIGTIFSSVFSILSIPFGSVLSISLLMIIIYFLVKLILFKKDNENKKTNLKNNFKKENLDIYYNKNLTTLKKNDSKINEIASKVDLILEKKKNKDQSQINEKFNSKVKDSLPNNNLNQKLKDLTSVNKPLNFENNNKINDKNKTLINNNRLNNNNNFIFKNQLSSKDIANKRFEINKNTFIKPMGNNYNYNYLHFNKKNKTQAISSDKYSINNNYPSVKLLTNIIINNNISDKKIKKINDANIKSIKINSIFKKFNINAYVKNVLISSLILRFEVISKSKEIIKNNLALQDKIASILFINKNKIRIFGIDDINNRIAIEIPNIESEIVYFKEAFLNSTLKDKTKLPILLGQSIYNKFIEINLSTLFNLLILGNKNSGKSTLIKSIILRLLMYYSPKELELLLIDSKEEKLNDFTNLKHLVYPIISDPKKAIQALNVLNKKIEERYIIFKKNNVDNIKLYNEANPLNKLSYIVAVITELSDLMLFSKDKAEINIITLLKNAKNYGIYLIIATENMSNNVLTPIINKNIISKAVFYLDNFNDSKMIINNEDATKLINKGDFLFSSALFLKKIRIQSLYIFRNDILKIVDFWKKSLITNDDNWFLYWLNNNEEKIKKDLDTNLFNDPLFENAKRFVLENKKASVSLLQSQFDISYLKALEIINALEVKGIISPIQ